MASAGESRRHFLKTVGVGAASLAAVGAKGVAASGTERPNILLYVTDDHGMDDAGCYGNPVIRTPGLDALAQSGTRFRKAFATTASCSPSRSVLLTGLHNHANGMYGLEHSYHHFKSFDNILTLPVMLASVGYRTACAGKYHVAPEPTYHFEQYPKGSSPETLADACRSLVAAQDDRPFFLYFCTTEPHRPFRREGSATVDPRDVIVPPYLPDTPECRQELAEYYGSVARADRGLVRLMNLLQETGHWEDTVIIYLSDNGIPFPGAKTTTYEPGLRLPCVVRDPAQPRQGMVSDAMISWADITPTILDIARATPDKAAFHGRSFRAVLGEENPEGWDEVYASHTFHEVTMYYPMRAVRERRYKLIWNLAHGLPYPFASDLWKSLTWQAVLARNDTQYGPRNVEAYIHRPRFELYDLEEDPWEARNLADDPAHTEILVRLQAKLKMFQERTKDPWILKWDRE